MPALGGPCEEPSQSIALAPNEPEEFRGPQRVHVTSEKSFEAPANVRASPRAKPVALCSDPVVAERSDHNARLIPALALAQRSNVGHVVASVPRIVVDEIVHRHHPKGWVPQAAGKISWLQRAQQYVPTQV